MIERNKDIVCFVCVTEMFNECQILIASTTTLIPQSIQTNGTCYSFTDNGTYTVYAHDIENGIKILTPAIVIEYTVDWNRPSQTVSVFSSTKEFIIYQTSSKELIFSMEPCVTLSISDILKTTNDIDHQSQSQITIGYTIINEFQSSSKESVSYSKELITSSKELLFSMEPSVTLPSSAVLNTTINNNNNHQSMNCTAHTSQIIIIILGVLLGLTTLAVLILSLAMIVILRKKGKARSDDNSIPDQTPETYEIPVTTKENPSYEMISSDIQSINNNYYETVSISSTTTYDVPRPQASQN
ncbi:PREDICTED: uncharacterized protein LOC109582950 isoform X2 [Amphimedon queenslandica]|uniref:Uncharacterized protein n=1 Tax=Amphimedon queenslandica TaxID=400682 RepID=A0AAN0JA71_AMPQE|nr:PREDICTED: uncharacterized protein LOC109582950 isoform X2 [Amphimedon queenslandica]|eukprot:XP_019853608.1 PREDICTED: uncharacterized protein LOC109582950 isoform X2 [Amphimedon queenslandica]